jgi:hypothetical protein
LYEWEKGCSIYEIRLLVEEDDDQAHIQSFHDDGIPAGHLAQAAATLISMYMEKDVKHSTLEKWAILHYLVSGGKTDEV